MLTSAVSATMNSTVAQELNGVFGFQPAVAGGALSIYAIAALGSLAFLVLLLSLWAAALLVVLAYHVSRHASRLFSRVDGLFRVLGVAIAFPLWLPKKLLWQPFEFAMRELYTGEGSPTYDVDASIPVSSVKKKEMACAIPAEPVEMIPGFVCSIVGPSNNHIGFASRIKHPRGDLLVTALHVLSGAVSADGSIRCAKGEAVTKPFKPSIVFAMKSDHKTGSHDMVAIRCHSSVSASLGVQQSKLARYDANAPVSVLSPPRPGDTRFRRATAMFKLVGPFRIAYQASTQPGSSGSPLFNNSGVVGVHTSCSGDVNNPWNYGTVIPQQADGLLPKTETLWRSRDNPFTEWDEEDFAAGDYDEPEDRYADIAGSSMGRRARRAVRSGASTLQYIEEDPAQHRLRVAAFRAAREGTGVSRQPIWDNRSISLNERVDNWADDVAEFGESAEPGGASATPLNSGLGANPSPAPLGFRKSEQPCSESSSPTSEEFRAIVALLKSIEQRFGPPGSPPLAGSPQSAQIPRSEPKRVSFSDEEQTSTSPSQSGESRTGQRQRRRRRSTTKQAGPSTAATQPRTSGSQPSSGQKPITQLQTSVSAGTTRN